MILLKIFLVEVPAETINLEASSKDIFKYITSSFGNINKKPLVGFGVVGTKTLIKFFPVFLPSLLYFLL